MNVTATFFDLETGRLVSVYSGPKGSLKANTPEGCGVLIGEFDLTRQSFDVARCAVIDLEPPPRDLAAEARAERSRRISACDWIVTRAAEAGTAVPQEWAQYRQALRDVPLQEGFPSNVVWPNPPA